MAELELDNFVVAKIQERVEAGGYSDASSLVLEALGVLEQRDNMIRLRRVLKEAREEIERGEYGDWTPDTMSRLRKLGSQLAREGHTPDPDVV